MVKFAEPVFIYREKEASEPILGPIGPSASFFTPEIEEITPNLRRKRRNRSKPVRQKPIFVVNSGFEPLPTLPSNYPIR